MTATDDDPDTDLDTDLWCGCCGDTIDTRGRRAYPLWCGRCAGHVARRRYDLPVWETTYQARHGVPCPYQVGAS